MKTLLAAAFFLAALASVQARVSFVYAADKEGVLLEYIVTVESDSSNVAWRNAKLTLALHGHDERYIRSDYAGGQVPPKGVYVLVAAQPKGSARRRSNDYGIGAGADRATAEANAVHALSMINWSWKTADGYEVVESHDYEMTDGAWEIVYIVFSSRDPESGQTKIDRVATTLRARNDEAYRKSSSDRDRFGAGAGRNTSREVKRLLVRGGHVGFCKRMIVQNGVEQEELVTLQASDKTSFAELWEKSATRWAKFQLLEEINVDEFANRPKPPSTSPELKEWLKSLPPLGPETIDTKHQGNGIRG